MANLAESRVQLKKVKEKLYESLDLSSVSFEIEDKLRQFTQVNDSEVKAEAFYWQAIVNLIQQPKNIQEAFHLCQQAIKINNNHTFSLYLMTYLNLCFAEKSFSQEYLDKARRCYQFAKTKPNINYALVLYKFFRGFIETNIYEGTITHKEIKQGYNHGFFL